VENGRQHGVRDVFLHIWDFCGTTSGLYVISCYAPTRAAHEGGKRTVFQQLNSVLSSVPRGRIISYLVTLMLMLDVGLIIMMCEVMFIVPMGME